MARASDERVAFQHDLGAVRRVCLTLVFGVQRGITITAGMPSRPA